MLRRATILAVLVLAPIAGFAGDRMVRGACSASGCDYYEIISALPYIKNEEGTLIQTSLRTIRNGVRGLGESGIENGYVFCSLTRPAIIAVKGGRTMAYLLAPLAPGQAADTIEAEAGQHAVYFGVCHGVEAGIAAASDPESVAENFGYDVSILLPQQIELRKPEDIMQLQGEALSAERFAYPSERKPDEIEIRELEPLQSEQAEGLTRDFGDRLDRLLGRIPGTASSVRPDAPYDGPFVDDAWLSTKR